MLAVYTPDQARQLVKAGIHIPILLLMPLRSLSRVDPLYRSLVSGNLHCVVHSDQHLSDLIHIADMFGATIPVHLEIDTGMSRGGVATDEVKPVLHRIQRSPRTQLAGIFTHFSSADSDDVITELQHHEFVSVIDAVHSLIPKNCLIHAANSDATFRNAKHHLDMIRVGLSLFGFTTPSATHSADDNTEYSVKPIVRWMSNIVHTKWIKEGITVGYGSSWVASRPTRVGLIPVGYADGYPIALSNRATVRVALDDPDCQGWFDAPVIGQVSMDQTTIDITDLPPCASVSGLPVEVMSNDLSAANHLMKLANLAGTIPYEILCGLSARIPRIYKSDKSAAQPVKFATKRTHRVQSIRF